MNERHPPQKRHAVSITISIIGCLSILLMPSIFAQVTNPSTGDTIAQYCSNGTCHTPGTNQVINRTSQSVQPIQNNDTVGSLTLTQSCIDKTCNKIVSVQQLGKIGIQLSQVCLRDAIFNLTTTCLNYNDLKPLDNTIPFFAGQWVHKPYEHRLAPKIRNHENFNQNPWAIMVDPNADFTTSAKMIIVDTHFTWTNQNDTADRGLAMKSYKDRYVSDDCNEARVGPSLPLIQDTITYLESGCTSTSMNTTKIISQAEIPFSYDNSFSTLHLDTYYKSILHGHTITTNSSLTTGGLGPQDCIRHTCSFKDPYAKAGW